MPLLTISHRLIGTSMQASGSSSALRAPRSALRNRIHQPSAFLLVGTTATMTNRKSHPSVEPNGPGNEWSNADGW
jgi:hypothetical protein